jgi:hypothetical protein
LDDINADSMLTTELSNLLLTSFTTFEARWFSISIVCIIFLRPLFQQETCLHTEFFQAFGMLVGNYLILQVLGRPPIQESIPDVPMHFLILFEQILSFEQTLRNSMTGNIYYSLLPSQSQFPNYDPGELNLCHGFKPELLKSL